MSLDLQFNRLELSSSVLVRASNKVECRIPLTEEESASVIKIDAVTYLGNAEVLKGEIRYSGKAVFTVLYKVDGGIKKYEAGVEYSFRFACEDAKESSAILGEVVIENPSITQLNGIVTASGIVVFKGQLSSKKEVEYFEKDKNLHIKKGELTAVKEILNFSKENKIEEEFETDDLISNVLLHSEKVSVIDCQCGINSVIVDGEVEVNMLIEQMNKSVPTKIVKQIPFRVEVEVDGVSVDNYACVNALVKGASIKVYVDESKNKSSISIEVNLLVCGSVYENVNFEPCLDAYSKTNEIYIEKERLKLNRINGFKRIDFKVENEISLNDDKNSRLICLLSDKIEEISVNGLDLTGAVTFNLLLENDGYFVESVTLPISFTLPLVGNVCNGLKGAVTEVEIKNKDIKPIISFKVSVCYLDFTEFDFDVIKKVSEGEVKTINDSAISVYIPKPNDSLWEISKELGVSEDEILKINGDLTFPLSGEERIVIYREIETKD